MSVENSTILYFYEVLSMLRLYTGNITKWLGYILHILSTFFFFYFRGHYFKSLSINNSVLKILVSLYYYYYCF